MGIRGLVGGFCFYPCRDFDDPDLGGGRSSDSSQSLEKAMKLILTNHIITNHILQQRGLPYGKTDFYK